MSGRLGRMAARAGLLLFSFMSGTYALLAYIPFTYQIGRASCRERV